MMTKKTQWKLDAKSDLSPIVKCVNVSEYMQAILRNMWWLSTTLLFPDILCEDEIQHFLFLE